MTPTKSIRPPGVVLALCMNFDGWIVGGGAKPSLRKEPHDWDVLIPFHHWNQVSSTLGRGGFLNSFGGISFKTGGGRAGTDVWPGDLSFVMRQSKAEWAWHPSTNTRIRKIKT